MAKDSSGLIILLGGAAVAWYGYTQGWFSSLFGGSSAASTLPTTGPSAPVISPANPPTVTPPAPPTPTTTPANLAAQLTAAAGSSAQFGLTPDQWSYYYQQLSGKAPISAATFNTMLSKAGITDATRSNPQSADYFVGMLSSVGLSGLGLAPGVRRYIPVPRVVFRGRGFGQYTMADLRRAGRR